MMKYRRRKRPSESPAMSKSWQNAARAGVLPADPHPGLNLLTGGQAEPARCLLVVLPYAASVDFDAGADAIQASAVINGRMFGAAEDEIQAAIVAVGTALRHPIMRRAAASVGRGGVRRETPVLLTLDDGSLAEGVVDLAFREDTAEFAGWTVVDFKTDREFAGSSAGYLAQVRAYSEAIGVATGSPARGIVLVL
jgi:ATP-dependent helicase/nuclease subunit A